MSALTRILNNQIYNNTIVGYQKIAPGTLTGTLFASNVTVPGDFLVTGNLFVLGTSAYTTIASTNTYVNDPLILLNNGYSGTNTYDEGLVFNRGSLLNQAFIWSEFNKEFRLIGTTETGTSYGNVAVTNYANINLGNLTVQYSANVSSLQASGNISAGAGAIIAADLAVNGGDITTSSPYGNVFNAGATSINAFRAATGINIGATTGVLQLNNPSIQGNGTTQDLFTSNATTLNFATSATALTLGATTGVASLQNANIWLPNATTVSNGQDTLTLFSLPATVSAFASGTVIQIGATSGLLQINNPTVDATQSTVALFNANVTTLNFAGAASTINMGANSGTLTIGNPTVVGTQTTQALYNTTATTLNAFGAATTMTLGATSGLASIRNAVINLPNLTDLVTSQSSINVFNANVTTLNLAGDGATITIGATTGTTTIRNAITAITGRANVNSTVEATTTTNAALTVAGGAGIDKGLIVGGTFYANGTASTTAQGIGAIVVPTGGISVAGAANIAGAITTAGAAQFNNTITVGGISSFTNTTNATDATGDTGALRIKGGASIQKDLWVGGNIYASNIYGVTQEIITVKDPLLYLEAANTFPYNYDIGFYSQFVGVDPVTGTGNAYQHTGVVRDNADSTWKFFSNVRAEPTGSVPFDSDTQYDPVRAGNLTLTYTQEATSATTGSFKTAGGIGVGGNIFQTGTQLQTSASNFIFATTPTTVDAFKAATDLEVGATSGTLTINNPTVVGSQTTQSLFNTVADTINFGRAANITMGINAGTTTVQGNLTVQSVRESTSSSTGALTLSGGLGVTGNIFQGGAYHDTSATNALVFNTPSTVDAFKSATDLEVGATSGTMTINNPTVVGSQATQALFNTVASTVNFARAANITMGHTDGTTTLQGNANIRATTKSVTYTQGAITTAGGVGVAGNVSIAGVGAGKLTIGTELVSGVVFPENIVQIVGNTTTPLRSTLVNLDKGAQSFAEYTVLSSNGSNTANFISTGITSENYSIANVALGATTGYTVTNGGSLLLGSQTNDVIITAGGILTSNIFAKFYSSSSNVAIIPATISTTPTTGALTVAGGVGLNANLYVNNGATFNYGQSSENFVVQGKVTTSLIVANSDYGAVVFGGSNATPTLGAVAKFNSTDSIQLPVGPTSARPSGTGNVDLAGMMRFNSTVNNLEFYDGSQWQAAGSVFTVISDRQFGGNTAYGNVDGVNTTFTIQSASTTAGTLVSINGVMQFPVLAYSVTGDQLEFTEAPALNDVIDVRVLATTTTVSTLASGNGYNQFIADNTGATIWTGTSSTTERIVVDPVGNFNILTGSKVTYTQTAVNAPATGATLIDTWSKTGFTTAKYVIQAKVGSTNMESYEAMIMTDGNVSAYVTTYGIINNGTTFGTITANVSGSNVNVYYNTSIAQANVKAFGTFIV